MIKKKAKSKSAKKTAKTKSPRSRKERNPAGVRNDIAKIVESGAKKITKAVMDQAIKGQLGPAKYLFEMASIFPAATDGSFSTTDEESLAATLMRRLNLSEEPIMRDEEDDRTVAPSVQRPAVKAADAEERESDAEPSGGSATRLDEHKDPVPV
jgi:hypothetical protein